MTSDSNDRPEAQESPAEPMQIPASQPTGPAQEPIADQPADEATAPADASPRRRILIGSQRDPAAYRPKPKRDWVPTRESAKAPSRKSRPSPEVPSTPATPPPAPAKADDSSEASTAAADSPPASIADAPVPTAVDAPLPAPASAAESIPAVERPAAPPAASVSPEAPAPEAPAAVAEASVAESVGAASSSPPAGIPGAPAAPESRGERPDRDRDDRRGRRGRGDRDRAEKKRDFGPAFTRTVQPASVRQRLSPDLEAELEEALSDVPLDEMIAGTASVAAQAALEPESRHTARVIAVRRDDVFVELGGREQGIVPLRSFQEPPAPDQAIEVVVVRFNQEEGLYELTLPNIAASVGDWSSVSEGMLVEARVTGHNTGGLECEVNRIRGFIPVSQIALYRVENLAEFVEQKFTCLVVEANPDRKNLVLSRRAVLEREKEEARQKLMESLAVGQIHDGVVRKLMDFGAFVDLGGVDGLLHISQLSWGRVRRPGDVLEEGQRVRVRIDKIDRETGKISLGYKDLMESPWASADRKYLPNTPVHGRVVKLMEFGAFVELEPGVEGLVHISELAHKRVARVSDVLKEGDEIDVMVLAVDAAAKRISLSLKNLAPPAELEAPAEAPLPKADEPPPPPPKPKKPAAPLRGGLGRVPGGDRFGLKW